MTFLRSVFSRKPLGWISKARAQSKTATQLSISVQKVLEAYGCISEMTPASDEISNKLSHLFADVPEQAFHNSQMACQQHLHRLMADALASRDGDIESNPEVRNVIRAIFQLSVLRKSSPIGAFAKRGERS